MSHIDPRKKKTVKPQNAKKKLNFEKKHRFILKNPVNYMYCRHLHLKKLKTWKPQKTQI